MNKRIATLGLLLVTIIWGGGFVVSDIALTYFQPFQILTFRFLIGFIAMFILCLPIIKTINKEELKAGIILGILLFLGFGFQIVGLKYTTTAKNAFLTALNVVIVPFLAYYLGKKALSKTSLIGAICSLIGVGLLSLNRDLSLNIGDILTIGCAIFFALQIYYTGKYVETCRASVLNMLQMLVAFICSMITSFIFNEGMVSLNFKASLSILYLGLISTFICYLLQTTCQRYIEESKAAIILSMESLFGTILSVIILHEILTFKMIIGCALILSGVLISSIINEDSN